MVTAVDGGDSPKLGCWECEYGGAVINSVRHLYRLRNQWDSNAKHTENPYED